MQENSENRQERSDPCTTEKNIAETNSYLKEKLGRSQEQPETSERSEACDWHDRQDHAAKVGRILGEQAGTCEPRALKEKSDDSASDEGGDDRPPSGDHGKSGGDSGSLRRGMAPVAVDKQSTEETEQNRREETWGRDHQPTTAQASRFDHRSACQYLDRPPHQPDHGPDNPRRR